MNLAPLVDCTFEHLSRRFTLRSVSKSSRRVWLVGSDFVLDVVVDRDGASVRYVDPRSWKEYELSLFLALRARRGSVATPAAGEKSAEAEVERELERDARWLQEHGTDILSGDRGWQRDYPWPALPIGDDLLRAEYRRSIGLP